MLALEDQTLGGDIDELESTGNLFFLIWLMQCDSSYLSLYAVCISSNPEQRKELSFKELILY